MSTTVKPAQATDFDKNIFYVVRSNGIEEVIIANNEDEITDAGLVMSLVEVERIRDRLIATRMAVESASSVVVTSSID